MDESKLTGAELDRSVHDALGRMTTVHDSCPPHFDPVPAYSTDWSQGGPIIERWDAMIALDYKVDGWDRATWRGQTIACATQNGPKHGIGYGPTPLIAAMRAFVASKG